MEKELKSVLDFILTVDKMKSTFRRNVNLDYRPENDAEHSFHIAIMAMSLKDYCVFKNINVDKAVKMCLAHDLIEVYAGDTFCFDSEGNKTKTKREKDSADKLFSPLPEHIGKEFRSLWEEFDAMETEESKYANALDRLQPFMLNANTEGFTWRLAHAKLSQAIDRFYPIKTFMVPEIWDYVMDGLMTGVKKGYLIDDVN